MKHLLLVGLLATVALAGDYEAMFKAFKATHKKRYTSEALEAKRFKIFVENMKMAETLQAANPLATFGPNVFADLSAVEFKSHHNGDSHFKEAMTKARNVATTTADELKAAAGQKIDWRNKGAVTAVKNQGQCGSCWSFSTTGNIEGQWFLAGNTLTSLSEQELVSCDTIDSGCNGGLMDNAFTWLLQNKGGSIVTEESLPYNSGWGFAPSCPANVASLPVGATISSYNDIEKNEDAMGAYCFAHGPVAIALDATSFQTYTSGILTNCISQQVDHGVLIVGFDDTNVPPYWIIKNSWGQSWGEAGYIRVQKGTNQCLITEYPTSSIVDAKKGRSSANMRRSVASSIKSPQMQVVVPFSHYTVSYSQNTNGCYNGWYSETTPVGSCQPFFLGGFATSVCSDTSASFVVYNTANCQGVGTPMTINTSCITYGQSYSAAVTCQLAPFYEAKYCTDNECTAGCAAPQSAPLAVCLPFFLGGYAIATYVTTTNPNTAFPYAYLNFERHNNSDCGDSSTVNFDYGAFICSVYSTSSDTFGYVEFVAFPNP